MSRITSEFRVAAGQRWAMTTPTGEVSDAEVVVREIRDNIVEFEEPNARGAVGADIGMFLPSSRHAAYVLVADMPRTSEEGR